MKLSLKFIGVFLLLFSQLAWSAETNNKAPIYFLTLTDIHFDPFIACHSKRPCPLINKLRQAPASQWDGILATYDNEKPQFRQDTPYPLLKATLAAIKKAAAEKNVQFVLVLGDFLGHEYPSYYLSYTLDRSSSGYRSFANKTLAFLTNELLKTFPNISVFPVVGNNDSYNSDYVSKPNGAFFQDTANVWAPLLKDKVNRSALLTQFPAGGYYAIDIPNHPELRLVVLNTVLFSEKGRGKQVEQAAMQELDWLHNQLKSARDKNQKVLLAMHIPSGIDIYASLHYRLFRMIELWKRPYTVRFEAELKEFAPQAVGIFAGHLHTDWFQMLTLSNANTIPVTGTPSVSPIFGNDPGYKIYSYSPEAQKIVDFETHYYSIDSKQAISHTNYNIASLYYKNCHNFPIKKNALNPETFTHFADYYYKLFYTVPVANTAGAPTWEPYYWCTTSLV